MSTKDNQRNKSVHVHSLKAYQDIVTNITPRHEMILKALDSLEQLDVTNITDRKIAEACGFTDMNAVRPRISELIKMGEVIEGLSVPCPVTDIKVRTLHSPEKVEELMQDAEQDHETSSRTV